MEVEIPFHVRGSIPAASIKMSLSKGPDAATATEIPSAEKSKSTPKLASRFVDESYKLLSKVQVSDPTPEEAIRLRNQCMKWILPFLCLGYHLMFLDKQTVSTP